VMDIQTPRYGTWVINEGFLLWILSQMDTSATEFMLKGPVEMISIWRRKLLPWLGKNKKLDWVHAVIHCFLLKFNFKATAGGGPYEPKRTSNAALMSTWIFKHSKKLKNNCLFRLFPIFCRVTQKCFTCFYALRPLRVSLNKIYIYLYMCVCRIHSLSPLAVSIRDESKTLQPDSKSMRQIQIQKCVCLQPGDYLAKPLMFRHGFSTPDESSFPSV
jgi:hypothetical protein